MPIFTTDGARVYAAYFTRTTHLLLGLQFSDSVIQRPSINRRPPMGRCFHPGPLNEERIIEAVADGVRSVCPALGISEIIYVADDAPDYGLYERAARELARRHLALGQLSP